MKPVADSFDHLQRDQNCFMGDLIPTLFRTKHKLQMMSRNQLNYCSPLCEGLIKCLNSRFGDFLTLSDNVSDYVLASVTYPFFKLRWVPEGHIRQVRQCLFLDTAKHEADSNEGDSALTESQQ